MIVKNLSRKSGSGQLIRYILKYIVKDRPTYEEEYKKEKTPFDKPLHVPGVYFTANDIHHLKAEFIDAQLYKQTKWMNMEEFRVFVKDHLIKADGRAQAKQGKDITQEIIRHNIRSSSIDGFIKEFKQNESNRLYQRSDQVSIHHTILSWSDKDREKLTDSMIRDMAQEYIRLRGENNLYVGTVHKDRSHTHLHIAMSGTQLNGRSSRVSKQQFQEIKQQLQQYQIEKYKQLSNSLPQHGKGREQQLSKEETKNIKRSERAIVKNELLRCIETITPKSTEQFLNQLHENGYTAYYRSGQLTGVQHEDGLKFRFSRLGVDLKSFKELDDKKAMMDKELDVLQQLRDPKQKLLSRDIFNAIEKTNKEADTGDIPRELQELSDIREGNEEDRTEDVDIQDTLTDDNDSSDDESDRDSDDTDDDKEETDDRGDDDINDSDDNE